MADPTNSTNALVPSSTFPQAPTGSEMAQLATAIQEWKRVHDELVILRQESREKGKKAKVLESVIMSIMKKNNIGALDLKASGGRLLYKRKPTKAGLNPKVLLKTLTDHFQSEEKAVEAVTYITEHRESTVRESLCYEVNL